MAQLLKNKETKEITAQLAFKTILFIDFPLTVYLGDWDNYFIGHLTEAKCGVGQNESLG